VRLVRDAKTFIGKGIGYVMFSSAEEMQKALLDKKGMKFRGRDLRINRAVEPKRREKKMKRKAEALDERRKRKLEKKGDKDKVSDEEI
jgi:nucleolar protein 12